MSFLEELINEMDKAKQPKKESKVNKFLEFEKQLRDLAKSKGLQPRTFLEQLAKSNPELAKNKIIIKLIGEQDVPQQKGRDAKPEVLTKRAMNTVKKGIKQAANKQRRRMDKDAVEEDAEQDTQYAKMIIQQNPQEYKKFMQTGDLMDAPTVYEKLFAYFSSSDADDMMPYGTQKARDGDPYVWLTDKLDDLGLTEGNEFAQKVRQLKAQGAKKGTKFQTSDGEEHTLEQILTQTRQLMDMLERKIQEQSAVEEDKTDKEIDDFHRELDDLVHKHFGHSSDEKKEEIEESAPITEEEFDEAAGEKDACYHKVKSRYKVWPSAYASGALVKCRKVGASNWGNKSK